MTLRANRCIRLAIVLPLAMACAGAAGKAGDTVAAVDSPAVSSATVSPTPATTTSTDSASKAATPKTGTPSAPNPAPSATPTPTPSETVLTGKVAVGGLASDQRTTLQIEGGTPTRLTGPLEPELRRLNAATVWVTGAPTAGPPNAAFAVSRYEIVSIEGIKPVVGVLTSRDGATWVAAERDTVKLSATTPEMRPKIGAKVWVVGRRTGAELTPQSFGVLREP
jgi:hypothetical protein